MKTQFFAGLAAFVAGTVIAGAAWSAGTTLVSVAATLRPQISLSVLQDIDFGDIIVGEDPSGFIELSPDGTVTVNGTNIAVGGSVAPQPGQIDVTGDNGQIVDVSCISAVVANPFDETIAINILVAENADSSGIPCEGVGTPVVSIAQPEDPAPIFIGGQIDALDLDGLQNLQFFSSSQQSGVPALFQAVYQ